MQVENERAMLIRGVLGTDDETAEEVETAFVRSDVDFVTGKGPREYSDFLVDAF